MTVAHGLELGSLDLASGLRHDDGYKLSVLADGTSFGAPEAKVREIVSMLADGNLVSYDRAGNREVTFDVEIEAADGVALQAGEVALRRELYKPNTVTWTPPSDFAAPSVYEVLTSEMAPVFNDIEEMLRGRRVFRVTLTCAPFARADALTTFDALEVGGTASTVTVDTCDSVTGWEAFINGTSAGPPDPAWLGITGGLWVYEIFAPGPQTLTLRRTGSFTVSGTPYLVVRLRSGQTLANVVAYATVDGVSQTLGLLSQRKVAGTNEQEFVFQVLGSTVTSLTFENFSEPDYADFGVFDVTRTNLPPGQTPRQTSRIIEVGGTERTTGSLRISAPDGTSPLNLALVATWPDDGSGFSPPLRRWRTAGNGETVDAATFSGKREVLGPDFINHDIPVASLPEGTYQLLGLVRASVVGEYRFSAVVQSRHEGVTLGETTWEETVLLPTGWMLVPMGHFRIPIVAAKAGEFRVLIKTEDSTAVEYDEAWLFPMDEDCALTAGVFTEPHVWLDSPSLSTRVPQVFEGASADKSDAHWPINGVHTMGNHVFTPGRTAAFAATHGVDWPAVSLSYHKRWHSNAAAEG